MAFGETWNDQNAVDLDDDEDQHAYLDREDPPCHACGGPGVYLGMLGNLVHYRCRNCGADFNDNAVVGFDVTLEGDQIADDDS